MLMIQEPVRGRRQESLDALFDMNPKLFENRIRRWRDLGSDHKWHEHTIDFVALCFQAGFNVSEKWFESDVAIPLSALVYGSELWSGACHPAIAFWFLKQIQSGVINGEHLPALLCENVVSTRDSPAIAFVLRRMMKDVSVLHILKETMTRVIVDMDDESKNRTLAAMVDNYSIKGTSSFFSCVAYRSPSEFKLFVRFLIKCGFTSAHVQFKAFLRAAYYINRSHAKAIKELELYDEIGLDAFQ